MEHPPSPGPSLVALRYFCEVSGADPADLDRLVRAGRLEGAVDGEGRLSHLLERTLPTAQELRDLGVAVPYEYDVAQFRSFAQPTDADEPQDAPAEWTMTWGEDEA